MTRETVVSESIAGGFAGLYPVFKALEEAGRVRRGYFIAGQGAAQFAAPGADDRLRDHRDKLPQRSETCQVLAATDPANPYGAGLPWPGRELAGTRPQRSAGAHVVLFHGRVIGYLHRTGKQLLTFLPSEEPDRSHSRQLLVDALTQLASPDAPTCITQVDGQAIHETDWGRSLLAAKFTAIRDGYVFRGCTVEPIGRRSTCVTSLPRSGTKSAKYSNGRSACCFPTPFSAQ